MSAVSRPRLAALAVIALAVTLSPAGAAGAAPKAVAAGDTAAGNTAAISDESSAAFVPFPNNDPFYTPPSPLPAGKPGDIVRSRAVTTPTLLANAWQVLHLSTSATGQRIASSATVLVPKTGWSNGPRPLVTYSVGTHGMADRCAPSYYLRVGTEPETLLLQNLLNKGWAVALTDYHALGTPGMHTYTVGAAEGRAVLDAARAAQRLPAAGLSATGPVSTLGYSQGGQASVWAGEQQPTYAPELRLVGVAAGGVPRDLNAVARFNDGNAGSALIGMAAVGMSAAFPDLPFASILNPLGKIMAADVGNSCVAEAATRWAFRRLSDFTTVKDPIGLPEWQARLKQSEAGKSKPGAPVFLYHADLDELIPYSTARPLLGQYCALGVRTQWLTLHLNEHVTGAATGAPFATAWIANRFAGQQPPSSC